jgi:hypothetical protein
MPVTGFDVDDLAVETQSLEGAYIESVEGSGDADTVWAHTGEGDGMLRIKVVDNDSVVDPGDGALGGPGAGNGDALGPWYRIIRPPDTTPPTVEGITRASVNPTSAMSVDYYVWFTENVGGVDVSDFEVVTTGRISGAEIVNVHGDPLVAIVTVSTGTGDGTIQLRLHDDDSIRDLAGNLLAGAGIGNGDYLNGALYTIYKSDPGTLPPSVESITRLDASPTDAFTVHYRVRLSEPVTGVDVADFVPSVIGLFGATVEKVSGAGDDYTVTVNTGNGAGSLRLDLRDNDSIVDAAHNPLGGIGNDNGHFTGGEYYQIVRDPDMAVRPLKKNEEVDRGDKVNVKWTSGNIGKNVRVELWRNGQRVAVLCKKVTNDGTQRITIPDGIAPGNGYTIRVISASNENHFTEMKKPFTVQ